MIDIAIRFSIGFVIGYGAVWIIRASGLL